MSIDVSDGKAKLTIAQDGATSLESKGKLELKGAGIALDAGGDKLVLKGSTVELN